MLPTKNYIDRPKTKSAIALTKIILKICTFSIKKTHDFTWFSIEKVHILRITHFSETTKDRNLIFGMDGDANVKLCIQHFLSLDSVIMLPTKNYIDRPKTKSAIVLTKIILKICTFSIKTHDFTRKKQ
jgi:hypothetical protein